ncbi:MAG: zinc-binding dehydrogenase [Propionibacteriaceae bacterium]|nr:zinc-binding dehydrogenase [Propionibacteriaceae bacterium]
MTPLEAAAIVETSATVASNFAHIGVRAGQTILIHGGTGGIGAMAVPYAHQLGLRVLTTVGSPAKMAIAEGYGADLAVDYHDDWPAAVMAASGGAGVDAILDIMGAKYLASNLSVLARGGRLCVIGLQGGVRAEINLGLLLNKAATVTATSLRFRPLTEKAAIVSQLVSSVWPLFADGSLPLPQLTSFPLTQAADAQRHLASGDNVGKVVLTVA